MTVYQVLLGIQFAGILLMMFMCGTIARRWTRPQHGWLFFYCIVTLVNNAGYLGVMQATSEEAAILALQFSYLGRIWIPFSLLCFVLELCERRLNPRVLSVLATFTLWPTCPSSASGTIPCITGSSGLSRRASSPTSSIPTASCTISRTC